MCLVHIIPIMTTGLLFSPNNSTPSTVITELLIFTFPQTLLCTQPTLEVQRVTFIAAIL